LLVGMTKIKMFFAWRNAKY